MKIFFFDTETTDLIGNSLLPENQQPRIIELYGAIIDTSQDFAKLDEIEFLCNPGVRITPEITKITGIKGEDVAEAPAIGRHLPAVAKILGKADAVSAHNLAYDFAVLNYEARRNDREMPWPRIKICTVQETEHIKGFRLSLSALHEHLFGEAFAGAHRARQDVEASIRCFRELHAQGMV